MKKEDSAKSAPPHPIALWILKAMFLILGISALVSGVEMIRDPTGKGLGFPEDSLVNTPFSNYLIPGFLLAVFVGMLSLVAWFSLWKKPACVFCQRLNPFQRRHWAWALSLVNGFGLMVWISIQMLMVPYFFLQPVFLAWGVIMILLCFVPEIRAFYDKP